jgi:hypothetical protein
MLQIATRSENPEKRSFEGASVPEQGGRRLGKLRRFFGKAEALCQRCQTAPRWAQADQNASWLKGGFHPW